MIHVENGFERGLRQWNAFVKGKRVMLTIENPDTGETNRKFIRVPAEEAGWRRPSKNNGAPDSQEA